MRFTVLLLIGFAVYLQGCSLLPKDDTSNSADCKAGDTPDVNCGSERAHDSSAYRHPESGGL